MTRYALLALSVLVAGILGAEIAAQSGAGAVPNSITSRNAEAQEVFLSETGHLPAGSCGRPRRPRPEAGRSQLAWTTSI